MDFFEELKTKHKINLNPQQMQAVQAIDKATLLLAVPGSGKTTVIITRIGNMIYNHSILPEQILTLTFSVAAAKDMRERFVKIFGDEYADRLQFRTIHSFCYTVVFDYIRETNGKKFEILDNNSHVIKSIFIKLYKEYVGEETIKDICQKIGYCKNMMFKKKDIEEIEVPDCDFYQIYSAYDQYKLKNELMDYDDMLIYAFKILKKRPDMLGKYQSRFKYFNVDEAQDTSYIQHEIIKLLAQRSGNIFMVGDEDQSIYGFRAAFPKALLDFKDNYKDATVLLMEENYRSTKTIVRAANDFIKQNKDRFDKNMFCENSTGTEIEQISLADVKDQYKFIVDRLKGEKSLNGIAVLYRNNDSAIPIVDALIRENIPFTIRENKPMFFSHFVVMDVLSFLKFSQNISDVDSFEKIYYKIGLGISKERLEQVKKHLKGDVFKTLINMQRGNKKFSRTVQSISEKFLTLRFLSPYKAIEYIENNLKYSSYLESLTKKGYSRETLNQKVNILKLIAINTRSFNDFFERLAYLESIMQNSNLKNNGVTLTTAHSSKGLEFDEVIMVDLIDRQFPSAESLRLKKDENDSSLFEEEVRLFYVAITRAKKKLNIITSNSLNGEYVQISRFVRQLTDRLEKKSDKKIRSSNFKPGKVKKSISNEDIKIYVKGVNVIHKKFGEGIVHSNDGEIIEIYFTKSGMKKLSVRFCLERGLLSLLLSDFLVPE